MVMKILSNSSNTKLYDDLEEIYERLTIIDLQFPDYTYRVNALKEEINSIRGFQSALVQEKTSTTIANVVWDTGKKNNDIPHVLDDYEEQAIAYIEKLLLDTRRVSSTRDNDHTGKNSKWDGSFRQDVISPLFRALISNIKRWTVSPQAFSWSDVIKASGDMHIKHGIWIVIKPVLMKLEETWDLETNMRIIVDTFPEFSETCWLPLNILKAALEEYISNNSPIMVGA